MFDRRSFLLKNAPAAALASVAALAASAPLRAADNEASPPQYFEVFTFRLNFGAQFDRFLAFLEKRAVPILQKHRFGTMGFFTVAVGQHIPAVVEILTYPSLAEKEGLFAKLWGDLEFTAAVAELESAGPPYFRRDSVMLRATSFCPALKPTGAGEPPHRLYELRTYESSTNRQHGFMHDRFAGGEIEVFHKCGIHPILYADTYIGPNQPNLVYLIPFESESAREKAWAAFGDHPDWKRISDEWMRRSGELARDIGNVMLTPTGFSMLR